MTDVEKAPLSLTQFYVMEELADMYPDKKIFDIAKENRFSMFDKVCGSKQIRERFTKNYKTADIEGYWNKDNDASVNVRIVENTISTNKIPNTTLPRLWTNTPAI